MNPNDVALFSANDQKLLVSTEPAQLAKMSQDELGDTLLLVRRARNKYTGLHRKKAGSTVAKSGARGAAEGQNLRTVRQAEVFEEALARVSAALATAARKSSAALKTDRIAMAKAAPSPAKAAPKPTARTTAKTTARPAPTKATTAKARGVVPKSGTTAPAQRGANKVQGAKRQAKRDHR